MAKFNEILMRQMRSCLFLLNIAMVFTLHAENYPFFLNGKIGFIDSLGHILVKPKIKAEFQNERIAGDERFIAVWPTIAPRRVWYLNRSGKVVLKTDFQTTGTFSEGLAAFNTGMLPRKYGYFDTTGKIILQPIYSLAEPFYNNRAFVGVENSYEYINKNGKTIFKSNYPYDRRFSEGLAPVFGTNSRLAYADTNGNIILGTEFEIGSHFSEGLALVLKDDLVGFINKAGRVTIPCQYKLFRGENFDEFDVFHEGRCFVKQNNRIILIDTAGNNIAGNLEIKYYGFFTEGLAPVVLNGDSTFYIDRNGIIAIKRSFLRGEQFSGGIAKVVLTEDIEGFINKSGKVIFQYRRK